MEVQHRARARCHYVALCRPCFPMAMAILRRIKPNVLAVENGKMLMPAIWDGVSRSDCDRAVTLMRSIQAPDLLGIVPNSTSIFSSVKGRKPRALGSTGRDLQSVEESRWHVADFDQDLWLQSRISSHVFVNTLLIPPNRSLMPLPFRPVPLRSELTSGSFS